LKLGTQNASSDEALRVLAAFGVNHICKFERTLRLTRPAAFTGGLRRPA
jgi:hypothetical protein